MQRVIIMIANTYSAAAVCQAVGLHVETDQVCETARPATTPSLKMRKPRKKLDSWK